jgi:hypothetical protein
MKNQQRPRAEQADRPSAEAEQREWEALIATAKQRQEQRTDSEAADWAAAIERAKALPRVAIARTSGELARPSPSREVRNPSRVLKTIDQREWEERIARARQRPTPAASDVVRDGARPSLRDRLERLAARAAEVAGARASAPRNPAAPTEEEEAQWRAAIHKAKTGHA